MRRLRRALALCLVLPACSSVEWREPTSTAALGGATLHEAELAAVAATNEAEAAEVYTFYAGIVAAMRTAGLPSPTRPLLLTTEAGGTTPLGDADATFDAVRTWLPAHGPTFGPPPDAAEVPRAVAVAFLAIAMPREAQLDRLPADWVQRYDTVQLVPSDACLSTAADAAIDIGLEREQIGFGKRLLLAPFLPMIRGRLRDELRRQHRLTLLAAALGDGDCDQTALAACLTTLGHPPEDLDRVLGMQQSRRNAAHEPRPASNPAAGPSPPATATSR